jgi:putative addiction module CopG family antidote
LNQKYHERKYKQQVDKSAQRVSADDSQHPQNQKNYKDGPKHGLTSRGCNFYSSPRTVTTNVKTPGSAPRVVFARKIQVTIRSWMSNIEHSIYRIAGLESRCSFVAMLWEAPFHLHLEGVPVDNPPFRSFAETMQIQLTPEQSSFVDLGIQEGRFRDSDEAVRQALAQWERRERARLELLASLDLAEQSLETGEGETYTPETLHELVESIQERGRVLLAGK